MRPACGRSNATRVGPRLGVGPSDVSATAPGTLELPDGETPVAPCAEKLAAPEKRPRSSASCANARHTYAPGVRGGLTVHAVVPLPSGTSSALATIVVRSVSA